MNAVLPVGSSILYSHNWHDVLQLYG